VERYIRGLIAESTVCYGIAFPDPRFSDGTTERPWGEGHIEHWWMRINGYKTPCPMRIVEVGMHPAVKEILADSDLIWVAGVHDATEMVPAVFLDRDRRAAADVRLKEFWSEHLADVYNFEPKPKLWQSMRIWINDR
jgi:hypothetical protein